MELLMGLEVVWNVICCNYEFFFEVCYGCFVGFLICYYCGYCLGYVVIFLVVLEYLYLIILLYFFVVFTL